MFYIRLKKVLLGDGVKVEAVDKLVEGVKKI